MHMIIFRSHCLKGRYLIKSCCTSHLINTLPRGTSVDFTMFGGGERIETIGESIRVTES